MPFDSAKINRPPFPKENQCGRTSSAASEDRTDSFISQGLGSKCTAILQAKDIFKGFPVWCTRFSKS